MNVVIYANCQGSALKHVLRRLLPKLEVRELSVILNFEHINSGVPLVAVHCEEVLLTGKA